VLLSQQQLKLSATAIVQEMGNNLNHLFDVYYLEEKMP
jgi:hypothetical protein